MSMLAPARVLHDLTRRSASRNAGHAAAGMRARSAQVEALHGHQVVGVAEHRPRREQLIERERAVKDVAADEAELTLEIQWRQRAPAEDTRAESGREPLDGVDHEIGDFLARVVP